MDFSDLHESSLQAWERPEGVILEGITGSRAYGLEKEGSDTDRKGVFLAPSDEFFGLDPVAETVKSPWSDEELHELGKFCRLALKVNPTITEVLWLDEYEVLTPLGRELVELRPAFLSAGYCRSAYLGYARSQFSALQKRSAEEETPKVRDKTAKNARHTARLLVCGFGLWSTGELQVRVDAPKWFHDFGDRVADGDRQVAEDLLAKYEEMFADTASALAAEPDRERVDAWLRSVRARALQDRPATLGGLVKSR